MKSILMLLFFSLFFCIGCGSGSVADVEPSRVSEEQVVQTPQDGRSEDVSESVAAPDTTMESKPVEAAANPAPSHEPMEAKPAPAPTVAVKPVSTAPAVKPAPKPVEVAASVPPSPKPVEIIAPVFKIENCAKILFFIDKSDNANAVQYEIILNSDGTINKDVFNIYWILNAKNGEKEGLSFLERPQYGIKTKELIKGVKYQVNLRNDKMATWDIIVEKLPNSCPTVSTKINGEMSRLKKVHVYIDPKSGMIPSVVYLDFLGVNASGVDVTERVMNN